MKKIIRLTESDLARIVKRVIKESSPQNVNFDDLIGKTVKFTTIPSETIWFNSEFDEYTEESFELEPLSQDDMIVWRSYNKEFNLRGKIKNVRVLTGDIGVEIIINNLQGGDLVWSQGLSRITYVCDEEKFSTRLESKELKDDTFFSDGFFEFTLSNKKLSENLQNRLPCGNFDFVMNNSTNNNFA